MLNFSQNESPIPTLTFTKAELVYALQFLLTDIPATDNVARIEMVELRHYLNQIKEKVSEAAAKGMLGDATGAAADVAVRNGKGRGGQAPSMEELRTAFPALTDAEIAEALANAREERGKETEAKAAERPSFVVAESGSIDRPAPPESLSKKVEKDRIISTKFARMLGT